MNAMRGKDLWTPARSEYNMRGFGGHAMCVIGYDDNKSGGAFQIMNSWGEQWGDRGYCWVRYTDFEHFTKEAYGLYPMGNTEKTDPNKLSVDFGLVDNRTQQNINLSHIGGNVFRTTQRLAKGSRFKIEVGNSVECFVYVFGEETDGSSYVLFPYTNKHSPYCGITGTRLFPRNQSLMVDDIGIMDRVAVVVSKGELNFLELNKTFNAVEGDFMHKVNSTLANFRIRNVSYSSGDVIHFDAETGDKKLVVMMIEVTKK